MDSPSFNYANTASSGIYQIRMNDFCMSHIKHDPIPNEIPEIQRPKCSISPVNDFNTTQAIINDSNYLNPHLNVSQISNISPFVNKICSMGLYPLSTTQSDSGLYPPFHDISNTASPMPLNQHPSNKHLLNIKPQKLQYQSTPNKLTVPTIPVKREPKTNFHSICDLAKSSDESNTSGRDMSSGYLSSSNVSGSMAQSVSSSSVGTFNEHFKFECKENKTVKQEFIYKTKRRPRAQITRQQRDILEYAYRLKCYPDATEVEYLCNVLGFEENVIRIWFQNKRARNKTSRN